MKRYLIPLLLLASPALADPRTDCPNPAPCKILQLSAEEERVLTGQNGILDSAAAARMLDLAPAVAYFKTKITSAPAGDVKEAPKADVPVPAPRPPEAPKKP